ncbi:unnamed protein product [Rhizophagus irregularis]|nr:unnamed protein product [Rhizophagus irregularis]
MYGRAQKLCSAEKDRYGLFVRLVPQILRGDQFLESPWFLENSARSNAPGDGGYGGGRCSEHQEVGIDGVAAVLLMAVIRIYIHYEINLICWNLKKNQNIILSISVLSDK